MIILLLLFFAMMFLSFPFFIVDPPRADRLWLKRADVERIEAMLGNHPTLTDEDLRAIVTMQLQNVLAGC